MKTFWKKLYTIGDLEVVGNGSRFLDLETDLGLGEPCPLLSLLQLLLGLPELGQVEGGDLLLKDGQEGHGLLKHVNALLQIHTEVNVGPVQTLADVHFLLKGEHVGVEELLQLLVDVVDADLLKTVVVEDLKAGDVEDTDVGDLLHGGVAQGLVTLLDSDPEGSLVDGTGNTRHRGSSVC